MGQRRADDGDTGAGLDADTGEVVDVTTDGVVEPLRVKTQADQLRDEGHMQE